MYIRDTISVAVFLCLIGWRAFFVFVPMGIMIAGTFDM